MYPEFILYEPFKNGNLKMVGVFTLLCLLMLSGCGSGGSGGIPQPPPPVANCDSPTEFCGAIPLSTNACSNNQYWPLSTDSALRPITVHYSRRSDEQKAIEILGYLENSWNVQVDSLGFSPPLDDGGACGSDGKYDVFIWRGIDGAFVDAIADNPLTPYDDYLTYMAIDITGITRAAFLDTTVAHEFNHTLQASDDWWESSLIFEMTATYIEALVYPQQDDYFFTLDDFQLHPEWSLFYFDNYQTWYMYGAAMYLHFISERFYVGDPGFIARMWRMSRNAPGASGPDFLDALQAMLLNERGVTLDESIVEFMQWRWFVAGFDDGAHFTHGGDWSAAVTFVDIDATVAQSNVNISTMIYGAAYVRLVNNDSQVRSVQVDLQFNDSDIDWSLTSVDGMAIAGSVMIPAQSSVVLVTTILPLQPVSADSIDFTMRDATLTVNAL